MGLSTDSAPQLEGRRVVMRAHRKTRTDAARRVAFPALKGVSDDATFPTRRVGNAAPNMEPKKESGHDMLPLKRGRDSGVTGQRMTSPYCAQTLVTEPCLDLESA